MDTIVPEAARRTRDIRGEYDLTDWDSQWFQARVSSQPTTYVYLVMWPETQIVKAGITTRPKRWRGFMARGAFVIGLIPNATKEDERKLLARAAEIANPAFPTWQHSVPWLGAGGLGFTECFRMGYDGVAELIDYASAMYQATA